MQFQPMARGRIGVRGHGDEAVNVSVLRCSSPNAIKSKSIFRGSLAKPVRSRPRRASSCNNCSSSDSGVVPGLGSKPSAALMNDGDPGGHRPARSAKETSQALGQATNGQSRRRPDAESPPVRRYSRPAPRMPLLLCTHALGLPCPLGQGNPKPDSSVDTRHNRNSVLPVSVRVKICGITSTEDALAASTPVPMRLVSCFTNPARDTCPQKRRPTSSSIPGQVARVGVFVDADAKTFSNRDGGVGHTSVSWKRVTPVLLTV